MSERNKKEGLVRYECCEECQRETCRGRERIVIASKARSLGRDPLSCHTGYHDLKKYTTESHSETFIDQMMGTQYPKMYGKILDREIEKVENR